MNCHELGTQEGEDLNAKLTGAGRELKNTALLLGKKAKRFKTKQGKYITNHTGRHTRKHSRRHKREDATKD